MEDKHTPGTQTHIINDYIPSVHDYYLHIANFTAIHTPDQPLIYHYKQTPEKHARAHTLTNTHWIGYIENNRLPVENTHFPSAL